MIKVSPSVARHGDSKRSGKAREREKASGRETEKEKKEREKEEEEGSKGKGWRVAHQADNPSEGRGGEGKGGEKRASSTHVDRCHQVCSTAPSPTPLASLTAALVGIPTAPRRKLGSHHPGSDPSPPLSVPPYHLLLLRGDQTRIVHPHAHLPLSPSLSTAPSPFFTLRFTLLLAFTPIPLSRLCPISPVWRRRARVEEKLIYLDQQRSPSTVANDLRFLRFSSRKKRKGKK